MNNINKSIINIINNTFVQLAKYLGIILPVFLIINFNYYPFDLVVQRVFSLSAIIILIIIKCPLTIKGKSLPLLRGIDNVLIILSILMAIFSYFKLAEFISYLGMEPPSYQIVIATLSSFLVYEATRRIAGPVLPALALILSGYALHRGYSYTRLISDIFSYDGIFGQIFGIAISIVFMFLLFGNILKQANFGNFLIKLGNALVGGMSGGPAKIAVISSGLFATISGSAVANVVGTGSFTIPMMKKTGFEPSIAGAIEASASIGGTIMPPVMASAAFIMAEILQIPYIEVAKASFLPALAYYVCVYTAVDAYAKRKGIKGLPKNQRPSVKESMLEGGHLLLILFLLVFLLIKRFPVVRVAFLSTLVLFPLSYIVKKTRLNFKKITLALIDASDSLLVVGISCATIGSIIACIALTGLSGRIANFIIAIGGQNVLYVLFLVMVTCLIFGMALPATASYLVLVSIVGPTLVKYGLVPISAHLFIFYFGDLSSITPPVALAAFAAASIARAPLFKTALNAIKFSIVAFITPYMFVAVPAMVFAGDYPSTLYVIVMYVIFLPITTSWGIWGYTFFKKTFLLERIFYLVTAILIIYSSISNLFWGTKILSVWLFATILFHFLHKFPFFKTYFKTK